MNWNCLGVWLMLILFPNPRLRNKSESMQFFPSLWALQHTPGVQSRSTLASRANPENRKIINNEADERRGFVASLSMAMAEKRRQLYQPPDKVSPPSRQTIIVHKLAEIRVHPSMDETKGQYNAL
jgi:hypothetical protein